MTKWMLMALLSVVFIAAAKPPQDDVTAELKKLRGSWRLVEELDDGKQMSAEEARKTKLTFDSAGRWKVEIDGKVVGEGTAAINPAGKPKTIDYTFAQGENTGSKFMAIYELDGDSFRHCGVLKGARPSEFSSKPDSGHILTVFRREKVE